MKRDQASKNFVFDIMDMLTSPVLTHAAAWSDSIPDRLLNEIKMSRLIVGMQHKQEATDEECVAFIMTRTFEAPMDSDWTNIYTHLACKVCERHGWSDSWEAVQAPRELTDYQERYLLLPLRQWIYKRRRQILHQKGGFSFSNRGVAASNETFNYEDRPQSKRKHTARVVPISKTDEQDTSDRSGPAKTVSI